MAAELLCHLLLGSQRTNLAGPADLVERQRGTRRHQRGCIAALHAVNGGQGQPEPWALPGLRRTLTVGLQHFNCADLERAVAAGRRLQVQVVGLARIADDVTPELARAAIESVTVLGAFQASAAVRRALSDRTH